MIVAAILPELEIAERNRAYQKSSTNLSSWENYQRGMWHGYKMTGEDANRAEEYFQKVLVDDPQYVPAMAGLAWIAYLRIILNYPTNETLSRKDLLEGGLKHAGNAVTAADNDAFAQYAYGRLLSLNGEFDEAIERLNYAIEINPNYALAYHGLGYTLALGGMPADAVAHFDTALRLSPKDPFRWAFKTMRAYSLLQLKDYDKAVEWGRRAIRDNENMFWAYISVSSALGHLGRIEEAEKTFAGLLRVKPDFSSTTIQESIRFRNASDREHLFSGLYKAGLKD
jgi:tetratricopeptide (TPR) repeat protein